MRPPVEAELVRRVAWQIRLRWLAPPVIAAATALARPVLGLEPPWRPLLCTASLIALYNAGFAAWSGRLRARPPASLAPYSLLANAQVAVDWLALTFLLHYTGGIESPLSPFYLLHVVMACVLLSPRAAFARATLAWALLAGLAGLEYAGLVAHRPLPGYLPVALYDRPAYVAAALAVFATTLYGCVFLATTVTRSLRRHDVDLLTLQARLQDLYRRTQALYETSIVLSSSLQIEEVLDRMVRIAADIMGAKGCSIRLLSADGQRLELAAATGLSAAYLGKGPVETAHSPLDRQALAGKTVIVLNAPEDPRLQYHQELAEEGICSILCAPLLSKGQPIGVIRVYSAVCYLYSEDDAAFLEAVASAGTAAITNARAYRQLEELDQAKTRFVRLVAHELRSPLAAIQSLLDVVIGGYGASVDAKGAELLQRAERRLGFLLTLVNDLLDLAAGRVDGAERTPSPVDLQAAAARAVDLLQARAGEKGVALTFEVAPADYELQGIAESLESLVGNLVDNGIKYTPAGGRVAVALRREGDDLVLTVADTGIGIPPEALDQIFGEFYRAPNARAVEKEGTGLGLAIAGRVIEEHDGRVDVRSQVGKGTTFTVTLPITPHRPGGRTMS
jgi:signal transduction histidine kinase